MSATDRERVISGIVAGLEAIGRVKRVERSNRNSNPKPCESLRRFAERLRRTRVENAENVASSRSFLGILGKKSPKPSACRRFWRIVHPSILAPARKSYRDAPVLSSGISFNGLDGSNPLLLARSGRSWVVRVRNRWSSGRRQCARRGQRLANTAGIEQRACVCVELPFSRPVRLRRRPQPRWRGKACEQNCQNAGQEYAVKCPCATDGSDWRAKAADLIEIENIGADQRSHGSTDISQRRCIFAREDESKDRGGRDRHQDWHGNANTSHWRRCGMNNGCDYGDSDRCPGPELIAKHEIGGHQCRNHRTADIHSQNGAGRNHEWHHIAHAEEDDDLPRSDRRTGQHGDRKIEVASDQ